MTERVADCDRYRERAVLESPCGQAVKTTPEPHAKSVAVPPALRDMGCLALSEKTRWNRAKAPLMSYALIRVFLFSCGK